MAWTRHQMAVRAAELAMCTAEVPDDTGIVAPTAEKTIQNLGELGRGSGVVPGLLEQDIAELKMGRADEFRIGARADAAA